MKKRKLLVSLTLIIPISIMVSGVAYAGFFDNLVDDYIQKLIIVPIKEFIVSLLSVAMTGLQSWVFKPVNIMGHPMVKESLEATQYIATGLLILNVMKEILVSMYEEGMGDGGRLLEDIFFNAIKSFALIYLTPWILTDILIRGNDLVLSGLSQLGASQLMITVSDQLLQEKSSLSGSFLIMVVVYIIYALGMVILAVLGAFRYVQLIVLAALGPFLAVSTSGKGDSYNTWIRESVAVVFTQSFQCWMLWMTSSSLLDNIGNGAFSIDNFWNSIVAIVFIISTMMAPSFLKKWLHSSGMGGAVGGAAKAGAYRFMMKTAVAK